MPFQTVTDGGERMWTVALRRANPLTTSERLAGCVGQVWADSLEALQPLTDAQDELIEVVRSLPPAWSERASGPSKATGNM